MNFKISAFIRISLLLSELLPTLVIQAQAAQGVSAGPLPDPPRQMHLFQSGAGWVLTGNHILWTDNWGNDWSDITPTSKADSIDSVFFLSKANGWIVSHDQASPTAITILITSDSGKTWSAAPIAASDRFLRETYAGRAELSFVDSSHGWVLLTKTSSAASSLGDLFSTADGGRSWSHLPFPPVAGKMLFSSTQIGWLVGGPRNDDLYMTGDGGQHWEKQTIPVPKGSEQVVETHATLPHFSDSSHALLSVRYLNPSHTTSTAIYSSDDSGKTWQTMRRYAGLSISQKIKTSFEDSHVVAVAMEHNTLTIWDKDDVRHKVTLPYSPTGVYSVNDLQFGDALHGWLHIIGAQCTSIKTDCSGLTAVLKTSDGGLTFTPLFYHVTAPPQAMTPPHATRTLPAHSRPNNNSAFEFQSSPIRTNVVAITVNTYGIDSCDTIYQEGSDSLWNTTLNVNLGFYLGGETADVVPCYEPDYDGLYAIACSPWNYMPIWDGLQAPCATNLSQHIDPATAAAEGVDAANRAATKLNSLALYNSIAYLDLEPYPPGDASCSQAVKDYANSFIGQMHNIGFSAGIYANGQNIWDDLTPGQIANLPDAIWVPQYPGPGNAIEPLYALDDNGYIYWTVDQRIHQTAANVPTGLDAPSKVDTDFVDGYVALGYWTCPTQCNDPCDSSCPNYDPCNVGCPDYDQNSCDLQSCVGGCWCEGYGCCCVVCEC